MPSKPKELHPKKQLSWLHWFLRDFKYGEAPKLIGSKAITGYLNAPTKRKVTIRINSIIEKSSEIKIGIMGDTFVRMDDKEYRKKFEFVERVYKSTSKESIRQYEVELIKKFKKSHPDIVLNVSETLAQRLTTYNGSYYIYVVHNLQT